MMNHFNSVGIHPFMTQKETLGNKTNERTKNNNPNPWVKKEETVAATLTLQKFNNKDDITGNYLKQSEGMRYDSTNDEDNSDASSREIMRKTLDMLIKSVRMLNRMHYNVKSWNRLMKAMGKAESIMIKDSADTADIRKAIDILRGGMSGLKPVDKAKKEEGKREGLPLVLKLDGDSEGVTLPNEAMTSVALGGSGTVGIPSGINISI